MPRFYRRRYYRRPYGRRYRRYYRRRFFGRGKNVASNSRVNVVIPVDFTGQCRAAVGSNDTSTLSISPMATAAANINHVGPEFLPVSLGDLAIYQNYAQMYDEFKVNSVDVTATMLNIVGAGGVRDVTVATCWDRKATILDIQQHYPNTAQVFTNPSAICKTFVNNERVTLTRRCYASDLLEKVSFVDTDYAQHPLTINGVTGNANQIDAWFNANGNVQFFAPCFYLACRLGVAAAGNPLDLYFRIEYKVNVTFRNPKYGGAAQRGAAGGDQRSVEIEKAGKNVEEKKEVSKEEMEDLMEKLKKLGLVEDDDTVLLDDMKDSDDKS